jgi:predicted house-cleaning noncanonical NTP pyrophosphatase (MazG superfamily)
MKLIRDRIPEIAAANGSPMKTRKARPDELLRLLKEKLMEESAELYRTMEGSADEAEEMADVLEVVNCLLQLLDGGKLVAAATLKTEAKGHITDTVWVQDTDPQ